MALAGGTRLTASLLNGLFGEAQSDTQNAVAHLTSTSYIETGWTDSDTAAALTFIAPASGKVIVHNSAFVDNSTSGRTFLSWIIRTGAVIGSGVTFFAVSDVHAIENVNVNDITAGRAYEVTGLTPGDSYNIRQSGRVTTGVGEFQYRHLLVQPVIA